jgi:hypothetical protein
MNESAAAIETHDPSNPLDSVDPASPLEVLKSGHPRNGKIAQMPREQRDALNRMLSNGAPYDSIIEHFHSLGTELNRQNISNWKAGGYEDWLAQQAWLADINHESESAADLASAGGVDDTALHQGVIRLAVIQIFKSLKSERLKDAPNYTRLLNTLARLSREALCLRKHSEACAAAQAALAPAKDPKRELSDEDRRAIVRHVDEALGLPTLAPLEPARQPPPGPVPDRPRFPEADPLTSEQEHSGTDQVEAPFSSSDSGHVSSTHTGEDMNNRQLITSAREVLLIENQKSEIENPVPGLPPIENQKSKVENLVETPIPSSDASQDQPLAELGSCKSDSGQDQPIIAPTPESCQQCGQELPPLLPNGERPDPWCPNPRCQTSLPDPPRRTVQPQPIQPSNHPIIQPSNNPIIQ